ncbi:RluA family pseudouridine synthase [Tychonema sp. LEGE 07199]|uniref:RluA family pseudouridine synthase n=1 Tax=unclassified Tychonema TaxID=2642144 RepID=UPI00187EE323|nr:MULTISPECIES: RluA family pseudouridine synthase [unclassified Tychonema]MBE9124090.1 RluA family pseudouridine synthase [Tychonema sp. LEGE 07199]MBE9135174.1 RluA family pseudouridine synthase [Tychonema sp. LEGE 07196]
MLTVHRLLDFADCFTDRNSRSIDLSCNYWYEGNCPQSGELLRLPRTRMSEELARGLMQYLAADDCFDREGKMYGILLVEMASGEQGILKAFSGLLNGCSVVEGWVPPIPGRSRVQGEEARALTQLEAMKQELIALNQLPQRQEYQALLSEFELQLQFLNEQHRNGKQQREQKRQLLSQTLASEALSIALEQLNQASRLEKIERRQLKRRRDETLQPLKLLIEAADERMRALKKQRKELSRELQAQMHAAYTLVNFLGKSRSLLQLMPAGAIPTGTGDCCAPKLLHYAAANNLKPLAMAEFWWGPPSGDKIQGEFYGACGDRCQPLMGFLLSGLGENKSRLPIIYQDDWLIAVNKPAGLLSVPGRYFDTQDSVQSRLQNYFYDGLNLRNVHRLDLETSGILLLARDKETHSKLSGQFADKQVRKVYEAVLSGTVKIDAGTIELPLWGDPENRPCQQVNWECGKPSVTGFQVMAREGNHTRVEFLPLTGRTHQLRVHAADVGGLGIPILGDRLYGCRAAASRLHLHARELCFEHPQSGEWLHLQAATPF